MTSRKFLLIGFISFLLFCLLIALIFFPKIKTAIIKSGVIELLKESSPQASKNDTAKICFVIQNGSSTSFVTQEKKLDQRLDSSHAILEALLDGPKKGASTIIPKGTKLRGITIEQNIAFVDLSSKFNTLNPSQKTLAKQQILRSLRSVYSNLASVTILVEGQLE